MPTICDNRNAVGLHPVRINREKAGLDRLVADTGLTALVTMLEYKAASVIYVTAAYTSQTCHECGTVNAASRRFQAEFIGIASVSLGTFCQTQRK